MGAWGARTLKTSPTDQPAKDGDSLRSIITSSRSTENPEACLPDVELRPSDSHICKPTQTSAIGIEQTVHVHACGYMVKGRLGQKHQCDSATAAALGCHLL